MTDYTLLLGQAEELIRDDKWEITSYANISALIYVGMNDLNWVGFYLIRDGELQLGPFQGKPACTRIPLGKGVCGTAAEKCEVIRVADVHSFPGHIACDSASASEIVLPILRGGQIIGVLDIDSPVKDRFSLDDEKFLRELVSIIEKYIV